MATGMNVSVLWFIVEESENVSAQLDTIPNKGNRERGPERRERKEEWDGARTRHNIEGGQRA